VPDENPLDDHTDKSQPGLPDPPHWDWKRPSRRPPSSARNAMDERAFRGMGLAMGIGFALVVPVLIFAGIGMLFDSRFASAPVGMAVGVLLGTILGFVLLIRMVNRLNDNSR